MTKRVNHVRDWIQYGILAALAIFLMMMIFVIDIYVPLGVAVGAMYCIVIFYSWLLPGRITPIYIGGICTLLVIIAMAFGDAMQTKGAFIGVNRIISVVVIWVCVALVMMAKSGFRSLEEAKGSLENKVRERTKELQSQQVKIEQSEKRYRNLLDSAPDAIVIADQNGVIHLVNKQITNLFGHSKEELIGKSVENLLPERYRRLYQGRTSGFFKMSDKDEIGAGLELIGLSKFGYEFPIEVSLSPLETEDGTFVTAAIRDNTFRKQTEKAVETSSRQLQNKNKELEQFTYVASHDLQEPLRTITSFSNVLVNQYSEQFDETGKKSLQFILDATGRMSQLVKGLLDYGRLGKNENLEEIDCNQLINDLRNDLATAMADSKSQISIKKLPVIKGYEVELRLLFQNLISNGIKFRKSDVSPIIAIGAVKKKGEWLFSVKDNGIGIAKEHQERIFIIFQRLHNRREYEGTGIGLAHCRKIVELHGGRIWVESDPKKGSSFYFTISNKLENAKA